MTNPTQPIKECKDDKHAGPFVTYKQDGEMYLACEACDAAYPVVSFTRAVMELKLSAVTRPLSNSEIER